MSTPRYRTSSHNSVVARFNERFILLLGSCPDCLVLDDELNVLPISRGKNIIPWKLSLGKEKEGSTETQLKDLKESLSDTKPAGDLVKLAKTIDQAQAVLTFIRSYSRENSVFDVTLTASRGRGKRCCPWDGNCSCLGSWLLEHFCTSPSPENLKTLFEFIFKGWTLWVMKNIWLWHCAEYKSGL